MGHGSNTYPAHESTSCFFPTYDAGNSVLTFTFKVEQDLREASIFGLRQVRTPAVP